MSHPLTLHQSSTSGMLSTSWGPIVSALSLLLNTIAIESGLTDILIMTFESLICLSSTFCLQTCLLSCLQTLSKITSSSPVRPSNSQMPYSIANLTPSQQLSYPSKHNNASRWFGSIRTDSSRSYNPTETSAIPDSSDVSVNPVQLLCWKALLCVAQHFGSSLCQNSWRVILQTFDDLHGVLSSRQFNFSSPTSTFKSCLTSALDFSLMHFLQTSSSLSSSSSMVLSSPSRPNVSVDPSSASEVALLEAAMMGIFESSSVLLLTEESLHRMLRELGSLILGYPSESILIPFEVPMSTDSPESINLFLKQHRSNVSNNMDESNSKFNLELTPDLIPSESGCLGYVLELLCGIGPPLSTPDTFPNVLSTPDLTRSPISLTSFALIQLVNVTHQNRHRLQNIESAVILTRPLKVVLCGIPFSSTQKGSKKQSSSSSNNLPSSQSNDTHQEGQFESIRAPTRLQLEAILALGRITLQLIGSRRDSHDLIPSVIGLSQGVIFGCLTDIFASSPQVQIKRNVSSHLNINLIIEYQTSIVLVS